MPAPAPKDIRGPNLTESPTVWIWTDGSVGGPFPLQDVEALVASGEAPPGLLARVEGGEWMPWPAFLERFQPKPPEPTPAVSYPIPESAFAVEYLAVAAVLGGFALIATLAIAGANTSAAAVAMIATTVLGLLAYFIPTAVAIKREHHQKLAIIVLNLVGGWTVVGWIAALVWACTDRDNRPSGTTD